MNRLYKKCFIASGGLHVLLAVILIVCPAFLASSPKQSDVQPITFIPDILTDSPFAGGGDPKAGQVIAPQPTPPAPQVRSIPAPTPPEPKPVVKPATPPKPTEESLEPAPDTKPTRKKPEVTTKAVTRPSNTKAPSKDTAEEDARAREQAARLSRFASALDQAASNVGPGAPVAGTVIGSRAIGGGGPSYASYSAWVRSYYERAWIAPEDASLEDALVKVSVTIARDGTVVARKIVKRSGDPAVDASVQRALDRVNSVERPFPEGATDKERTYIIPFNLKTKRGTA